MFNDINKDTLIITNNSYKNAILEDLSKDNKLHPISFMSLKEFINNYFFTYDERTIYYLMKTYHYKYDVAKVYLDNLIYIEDKIYSSDKLNYLVNLKKELDDNNLLIYNDLFIDYIKNKNIIAYNIYPEKNVYNIFKRLNVEIINNKLQDKKIEVLSCKDIKDETKYVFDQISELLHKGINYENIKLIANEDYYNELERLSFFYNIDINLKNNTYFETEIVNNFVLLLNDNDLTCALDKIKETYNVENDEENKIVFNKILNICNKLLFIEEKDIFIKMFISLIKSSNINNHRGIELISLDDYISNDDYVFILGFNQNVIPKIYKDENYITDNLKDYVDIYKSIDKNKQEKEKTKIILSNIKNLTITYKETFNNDICYPSILLDDDMFIIRKVNINNSVSYSKKLLDITLGTYLDNLKKYGEKDEYLDKFYNSTDIIYDNYDNSYNKININNLLKYLNNNLVLSYTSMNDYYKCSFRYYLNYILKLNKFEDTFQIFIGNLFHDLLSHCFEENFDFDKSYNNYLEKRDLTSSEKFFTKKLREELIFIIETIKDQKLLSDLKNALYEEDIIIKINDNTLFKGKIDKIMYKEIDGINYISVIDYKTGSTDITLDKIDYGIGMQLPSYLYLIKKSNRFNNILFTGFYLQKILNKEINITPGKTYNDLKKDNLKLIGYSNSNEEILSKFDYSYENSEMIKSMKLSSNGFYHYAKVISNDEINNLITKVDEKIKDASNLILQADFTINPKIIDNKNIGCEYCQYKDICFVKEEDKVYLNKVGDDNVD